MLPRLHIEKSTMKRWRKSFDYLKNLANTEVPNLYGTVKGYQQIIWFYITVHYILFPKFEK